ncbi:TetR/AcrR family transcriptional regulator, tetracycline repressor protein [Frankia sp. Hr75.2]|nr:TetR/AcrR family transcriptional regulator, tetracycline repressor protein [Frankia sp. Hr75.2]
METTLRSDSPGSRAVLPADPPDPPDPASSGEPVAPGSVRWWVDRAAVEARRKPRAGGLSTARIIDTALEILREGGLDALSVRAVAVRLGTSAGSLYRHIASREELVALIADHVMGDIRLDRTGRGWRADVEALLREMRRVFLEQPLPPSATRGEAYGPNMLRVVDAALGLFLEAGLTNEQAAYATSTTLKFVAAATSIQRSAASQATGRKAGGADFGQLLDALPASQFTALRVAGPIYADISADDVFTQGMAILLDGVASRRPDRW